LSLKPPKKSDLNKSWMKKRRDKTIRIQPEYHLIVTEGTETELQYFSTIRDVINKQCRDKIHWISSVRGTICLACLGKQSAERLTTPMAISMCGLSMIRMIFRQTISIGLQICVARIVRRRCSSMQYCLINALSCGIFYISDFSNQISTAANIGRS
jgi:hypothetical protein